MEFCDLCSGYGFQRFHIICSVQGNHVLQRSRDITQITVDADVTWNSFQLTKKQPHAIAAHDATSIPTALPTT